MKLFGLLVLAIYPFCTVAQAPREDNRVIICLTYDDEIESHTKVVLPLLDSLDFKATFFMNSIRGSGTPDRTLSAWKKASTKGHEFGNHTLFHPCPEKYGFEKSVALESYSLESLMKEIEISNSYLTAIDGRVGQRAYAYPCNNMVIDGVDYSSVLKQKNLVKYGRAGADRTSIVRDFKGLDIMKVPSWLVEEGTTAAELIAFADEVRNNGKMGVYQFHGVGYPPFNISPKAHKEFLEYLAANKQTFKVMTFSSAMDAINIGR